MFKINTQTYPKLVLIGALSIYLLLAVYIFYAVNHYDSNKLPNLRKVAPEYRASLVENFLSRVYRKKDTILMLGDSQVMGGLLEEKYIFSTLLNNILDEDVINLAFGDSRILDNTFILEYAFKNGMKFKAVTYDINHAHVKQSDFQRIDLKNRISYVHGLYRDLKSFMLLSLIHDPTTKPPPKLEFRKYPGYFEMNPETIKSYSEKLENFIGKAKRVSEKVILYSTPHSREAIVYSNKKDEEMLLRFDLEMEKICVKNNVTYLKPNIIESEYFYDIVHFSKTGHKRMTSLLKNVL